MLDHQLLVDHRLDPGREAGGKLLPRHGGFFPLLLSVHLSRVLRFRQRSAADGDGDPDFANEFSASPGRKPTFRDNTVRLEGHRDGIRDHGKELRLTLIDAVLRNGWATDAAEQRNGFVGKPYPALRTNPDLLRQPCFDDGARSGS